MIVLIPAYEPGPTLTDLVCRLAHHTVVVVDDGSGPGYADVFAAVRALGAEVLTLDRNRGKGRALKTGFAHIGEHHPGRDVVCADSDGQHRPDDIEAVSRHVGASGAALVLGVRRFTGAVPARSRFGNAVTRVAFRLVTGLDLTDTQTGLRAYPAWMVPWLVGVAGERFEYEQRLLLRAARERLPIAQVEIATVYLRQNASSHFRPVRDSVRVYGPLLAFAGSSLLGFAVDAAVLFALTALTGNLVLSAVAARLISATVNYRVNRAYVFGAGQGRSALRYGTLAVLLLGANVLLLEALTSVTGSLVAAKLLTEATLFAASFLAQRHLVFSPGPRPALPRGGAEPEAGRLSSSRVAGPPAR
ncbi:glycosyltransferase [Micromonosporaceae bacterium Da 78-11]